MGWYVFFGSLGAYFLITLIVSEMAFNSAQRLGLFSIPLVVVTIILKGLDALILAGGITALLGHAYAIITKKNPARD
jgi:hypothetical protein